jgi:hypothetical protein
MPIQIETTGSIQKVERDLRSLEAQYDMTSEEFAAHPSIDSIVSEFDAIEWSFLIMQKRAFEEDGCFPGSLFSSQYRTQVSPVDVAEAQELLAA